MIFLLLLITFTYNVSAQLYDLNNALQYKNIVPVAVIGAGNAGLAAALFTVRGGFPTYVFTGRYLGGQLVQSANVENMPGFGTMPGKKIMKRIQNHDEAAGVTFIAQSIKEVHFGTWPFMLKTDANDEIRALSVIVATGSKPRLLGSPGESEHFGAGVSTCAYCDAPSFADEDVVVIGGGDTAVESALLLAPYVKSVTVLVRSGRMRAAQMVRQHLADFDNISVRYHTQVQEIHGNENGVTHITVLDNESEKTEQLTVQGVFLAIGHTPNTAIFAGQLDLVNGYIKTNGRSQKTSVHGVFAAGECIEDEYKLAPTASGDGAKAGVDAVHFLHEIGLNEKVKRSLSLYTPIKKSQNSMDLASTNLISMLLGHNEFRNESSDGDCALLPTVVEV